MIHKVCVHQIRMGDVDDPDLYIAEPLYKWEKSEEGQWIMKNSKEQPMYTKQTDYDWYGHTYKIIAWLEDKDLTYWKLKYE